MVRAEKIGWMQRLGKALLIGLAAALAAVVFAGAWFALTFGPNAYRDDIVALVQASTGRELAIGGDLSVSLFPRLGIKVGPAHLAQAPGFGTTPFAALTAAEADLRLWPLVFHRRVEIGRLRVQGLAVELRRGADGTTNWADLSRLAAGDGAAPGAAGSIRLNGADLEDARVHYVDEQTQTEYELRDGTVHLHGIALGVPFAVDSRFRLEHAGHAAEIRAKTQARVDGPLSFELQQPSIALELVEGEAPLALALDAPVAHYAAGTLRVDAPRVEIKSGGRGHLQVSGSLVAQSVTLVEAVALTAAAPELAVELDGDPVPGGHARLEAQAPSLSASLESQTLSVEKLTAGVAGLAFQASITGTDIIGAPRLAGHVAVARFSPRTLLATMGLHPDLSADPAALTRADLDAQYELSPTALRLGDVKVTLDDTNITGEMSLSNFATPAVRFDLAADRLVLDRYFASAALDSAGVTSGAGGGFSLRSEELGALDVEGVLHVAELTFAGVRASSVALRIGGGDREAKVAPVAAIGSGGGPGLTRRAQD